MSLSCNLMLLFLRRRYTLLIIVYMRYSLAEILARGHPPRNCSWARCGWDKHECMFAKCMMAVSLHHDASTYISILFFVSILFLSIFISILFFCVHLVFFYLHLMFLCPFVFFLSPSYFFVSIWFFFGCLCRRKAVDRASKSRRSGVETVKTL